MATFRKRSGAWQALVKRKGFGQIARTFDTKADAEAWARQTESEMDRDDFVTRKESEITTVSEALDRYEKEVSSGKKGHGKEKYTIDHWRNSSLAARFLSNIRSSDLAKWRDERLKEVSASTVNRLLNLLSHVFTVAAQDWGMGGLPNPVRNVRRPKNPIARERRLLPGELEAILSATKSPSIEDVIHFAIETGMRRGEIARMKWDHVDLKKKVLLVPETKTETPRRVPLSSLAILILEKIPRRIDGKVWGYDEKGMGITRVFQEATKRARATYVKEFEEKHKGDKTAKPDPAFLVDLTFQDLRHEATSRFFEKGLNPMQVAAITGHKTLQMLKRYTHLKAEDLAELLQ